jgi:PAS domain S-box-containing protein
MYKDGKFSGFIGIARDITEKKKGEERTAHLAAITEHTIDAIVSLDVDSRIVSWNRGAEEMFGYKAEEVIGKPIASLIPKELHDKCRENFRKAVMRGYAKDIETMRTAKDGKIVIVDQTLTSIYNSEGEVSGFVAIMRDITEKKKNEERLKETYEELKRKTTELRYLANIVENSNDAIYSIDMEGKITSWNKTAEKLFGWKKDDIIGKHISELLPEGFEKEAEYTTKKVKDGVAYLSFESKRRCRDGSIIDVDITVSPIFNESKELSGISIIARDVSHKVKTEQELIKRILKYKVEVGKVYLTDNFELALDVISDTVKTGFKGTIITRRLLDEVCSGCEMLWLSEKEGKNTIKPDANAIRDEILKPPARGNIVVLELDYLLTKLDFESILKMIQQIKEDFYILRRGILILVANPNLLNEKQLSLLKMECSSLRKKEMRIAPELHELLRFVYQKNRTGEKPSIKDTMDELGLSRNTVKKRMRRLKDKGYLRVVKYGRTKLLEITEEGRSILS